MQEFDGIAQKAVKARRWLEYENIELCYFTTCMEEVVAIEWVGRGRGKGSMKKEFR